jgi:predicted MFS family arabinose efflux permease
VVFLLALAVGLVLADSSVVTLALPDILRDLKTSVGTVAWVLIAFNLALAVGALPGSRLVRGHARTAFVVSLTLFALASAACSASPSMTVLIAARVAQGMVGAVVVAAALKLLVARVGGARAVGLWGAAGVLGAALGPAAGGFLTEAFSWQAMFALQAPVALLAMAGARGARVGAPSPAESECASGFECAPGAASAKVLAAVASAEPEARAEPAEPVEPAERAARTRSRPPLVALLALALISAALAAALFLLVVLLIEGWRHTPAEAALTVTLMPIAAVLAGRRGRAHQHGLRPALAGCLLIAGGLAGLGLLPAAGPEWTLAPQLAIGTGLGLVFAALIDVVVGGVGGGEAAPRPDQPAAWTIAARHAGIVAGLLILTPVFTADLDAARQPAERAGLARLLDAPLSLSTKLDLARTLGPVIEQARGELPDLGRGFDAVDVPASEQRATARLRSELDDQLDRAGTDAFSRSFLASALLALLAAGAIALAPGGSRRPRSARTAGAPTREDGPLSPGDAGRSRTPDGSRTSADETGSASALNGSRLSPGGPLRVGARAAATAATLLVAIYIVLGGGDYTPAAVADPCSARERPAGLGATQHVALATLDGAACQLRTSRESLLIGLLDGRLPAGVDRARLTVALRAGVDRARDEHALSAVEATALRLAISTRGPAAVIGLLLGR